MDALQARTWVSWFQDRFSELDAGLRDGDLASAWSAHRRGRHYTGPRTVYGKPIWSSRKPVDRLVVLLGFEPAFNQDVGYGDTFWMARYFPRALALAGAVTVVTQPRAERLLRHSLPSCHVVSTVDAKARAIGAADAVVDQFFLPAVMDDRDVAADPYISANESAVAAYRATFTADALHVGVCWGSEGTYQHAKARSAGADSLAPLASLGGVAWHSLMRRPGARAPIAMTEYEPVDFADTAALIGALDAVVTTDTAVANLAGAMGKPTFVVVPSEANFRWGRGETTPWYPSARVIRAAPCEPWSGPFARAGDALQSLMEAA